MANEKLYIIDESDVTLHVFESDRTQITSINDDAPTIIKIYEPGPQGPTGQSGSNAELPSNIVSSSAQVDYLGIQNKPDLTQYLPNSYSSSVDARFTQLNNITSSFVTNSQTSSFVRNFQTGSFVTNVQTSSMSVLSASYSQVGGGIYGGSGYIPAGTQATLRNKYDNFFINYYNRPAISVDPDGAAGVVIDSPQGSSSFGVTDDFIVIFYNSKNIRVSNEIELNNSSSNIFVSSSSVVIKTDNFSKKNYFYASRNFPGNTNQRSYIGSYSDPSNYIGTYHDNASNNDYIFTVSTLNTGSNIRNNMYISPSEYKLNRINENTATTSSIYVSDYISLGVSSSQNYANIYISESIKVRHGNSIVDVKEDEIVISGSFSYKNALYLSNFGVPNPTYRSFIGSYHDDDNYVATYQDEAGDGYYIFEGRFKDPTAQYSARILGSPALVQLFSSFAGIINTIGVDYNDGVKLSSASGSRLTQIVANPQTGIVVSNTATDLGMRYNALYSGIVNNDRSIPDVGIVKILANNTTGSFVVNSQTSSFVRNNQTGSFVTNSQTASFVTNSQTSSMSVLSASYALNFTLPANIVSSSRQIASDISGSSTALSSSITNRIFTTEQNVVSLNVFTGSAISRFNFIELTTGSLNLYTSSNDIRVGRLEQITGSLLIRINTLELTTGSFATTGSNIFTGTQQVTGSVNITGSISVNNVRLIDEYTAIAYSIAL